LESSSCLTTGWTAVTASPVTDDQTVSVTLPLAGPQQFFRLKSPDKDPITDKDPNEKDPSADKTHEGKADT
jgi:hypothetical protein